MESATTQATEGSKTKLHMSIELSEQKWLLGFKVEAAQKVRRRSIAARDLVALMSEVKRAQQRFGMAAGTPVVSCYEAGRDGFWLHRWLLEQGIENVVVDSSSIQVDRRRRRAKSDGLDVEALGELLVRYHRGERKVWRVVEVPSPQIEDARQVHRELATLKKERTRHRNRIHGLLASQGGKVGRWSTLGSMLSRMSLAGGGKLGPELQERIGRELELLKICEEQIRILNVKLARELGRTESADSNVAMMRHLQGLRGIGVIGSRVLTFEAFGWRKFANRQQVGAAFGLTPTPFQSGTSEHEQGISKAGNVWVRGLAVELAWLWLRFQPQSELSQWYERKYAKGSGRHRRIGIVAVARKLMVALWRYATKGEIPKGAILKEEPDKETRPANGVVTYVLKAA